MPCATASLGSEAEGLKFMGVGPLVPNGLLQKRLVEFVLQFWLAPMRAGRSKKRSAVVSRSKLVEDISSATHIHAHLIET